MTIFIIKKGRLNRTVLFTLFLNFYHENSFGVHLEPQGLDIPIAEILHFLHGSGHSCGFVDLVGKVQRVLTDQRGQMLFKLCKEDGTFQLLRACGAEIIYGTIIYVVLCEGVLDCRSAFLVFVHNEKLSFRQALDEPQKSESLDTMIKDVIPSR